MIIDLKRAIDLRMIVLSGAIIHPYMILSFCKNRLFFPFFALYLLILGTWRLPKLIPTLKPVPFSGCWSKIRLFCFGNTIFVNVAFVALCMTTILFAEPISISLFVTELEQFEHKTLFFFLKTFTLLIVEICLSLKALGRFAYAARL